MKHTLVALVENEPGVLQRVANLFSRRGFNIESLTVGHTDTNELSRMTIVLDGNDREVEQVPKQLYKLTQPTQLFSQECSRACGTVRSLPLGPPTMKIFCRR